MNEAHTGGPDGRDRHPRLHAALAEPLIDQHAGPLGVPDGTGSDRAAFERTMGVGPAQPGSTCFDTPFGLAVRRWCAPALGLDPHATPAAYLAARADIGAAGARRALLRAAGIGARFVDAPGPPPGRRLGGTSQPPGWGTGGATALSPVTRAGRTIGVPTHRVADVFELARQAARGGDGGASGYAARLAAALDRAAADAIALRVPLTGGTDVDPVPPEPGEVAAAAGRWLRGDVATAPLDAMLARHALWAAFEVARDHKTAVQLAVVPPQYRPAAVGGAVRHGRGADLRELAPLLAATQPAGVPIVLLGGHPQLAAAADLTGAFRHLHLEIGAALYRSADVTDAIAGLVCVVPFGRLLHGSAGTGLPECTLVAAIRHRRALTAVLTRLVDAGEWSAADAVRIARLIGSDNARRVYRLAM